MAGQLRRLGAAAGMPNVTMQILPAVANPGAASGSIIADESAYAEHSAGGFATPPGNGFCPNEDLRYPAW
jgi:hypothetical protein